MDIGNIGDSGRNYRGTDELERPVETVDSQDGALEPESLPPTEPTALISKLRSVKTEGTDSHDHHISRAAINFWLDALLLVLFVALSIVSTVVQFVFPPGTAAKGWTLWAMDFNQWSSLQYGLLATFGFACVVHVMLHWSWVCTIVSRKFLRKETPDDGIQTILGVALLIGLLLMGAVIVGTGKMMIQMPPQ